MKIGRIAVAMCAAGLLWAAGACDDDGTLVCPAGAVLCGSQCSNVNGDPDNCGACGNVCAHGSICDLGACTSAGFDAGLPAEAASPAGDAGATNDSGDQG